MQNAKAKTITITSVKGGTGKTTTVLNNCRTFECEKTSNHYR